MKLMVLRVSYNARRFPLGSLAELETQLILAQHLNYLTEEELSPALQNADEIGKMLKGLQKSLNTN